MFGLHVDASLETFVVQTVEPSALPLRAEGCASGRDDGWQVSQLKGLVWSLASALTGVKYTCRGFLALPPTWWRCAEPAVSEHPIHRMSPVHVSFTSSQPPLFSLLSAQRRRLDSR